MGALEGAGITVLAKGLVFPVGSTNIFGAGGTAAGSFPTGTRLLTASDCTAPDGSNPYPSNFLCNPSSIDGLGITNSSQGGGGIFIHAWGHNLQIANNRIYNNSGTLSGGINVGQGEYPPSYIKGSTLNTDPGSCDTNIGLNLATGVQEPYCQNLWVNMHNNAVLLNSSTGDELFSATPAGAGGVSICTGADYYKFNYNWVCGNLSSGDGGGVGHIGYSWNGDIEHNTVIFNQSLNPTIPANGGGILAMGAPDVDPTCSATNDQDCVPVPASSVGPSDGVGPNLVINANLVMGNAAEAGSGGGMAFQNVNGSDVLAFPQDSTKWHHVTVTNNIIADNVAGWDGGGVSMLDALNLDFINNTVVANNTTATAGVLNNTIGAPLASTQNTSNNCYNATTGVSTCGSASRPQPAGLVSIQNSAVLFANIAQLPASTPLTCPAGHYAPGTNAVHGTCASVSYPLLANNVFWQNAAFQVATGSLSPQYQQNVVTLYNAAFTGTPGITHGAGITTQTTTGQCVPGSSYWDLGVRGDVGPTDHSGGPTLNPTYSLMTSITGYGSGNNSATPPGFISQYCDGARQPPESGTSGWSVPPGIADATVPNPVFSLTPVATVDEGNNWINLRWGPLSMVNPVSGVLLANYSPATGPNNVPVSQPHPALDFFGNLRPEPGESSITGLIDAGAIEVGSAPPRYGATASPTALQFGNVAVGTTSPVMTLTLTDTGNVDLTNITVRFPNGSPFSRQTAVANNCQGTLQGNLNGTTTCSIGIVFNAPKTQGGSTSTVTISANQAGIPVSITVSLSGTAIAGSPGATLLPPTWTPSATHGCPVSGTGACPTQTFMFTNTGNTTLTGVGDGVLGGTNSNQFAIVWLTSTCGGPVAGQVKMQNITTLVPPSQNGQHSCTVVVRFQPASTQTANTVDHATVSVSASGGVTQTSTLTGTVH
jgi:hypothetical protein